MLGSDSDGTIVISKSAIVMLKQGVSKEAAQVLHDTSNYRKRHLLGEALGGLRNHRAEREIRRLRF